MTLVCLKKYIDLTTKFFDVLSKNKNRGQLDISTKFKLSSQG